MIWHKDVFAFGDHLSPFMGKHEIGEGERRDFNIKVDVALLFLRLSMVDLGGNLINTECLSSDCFEL